MGRLTRFPAVPSPVAGSAGITEPRLRFGLIWVLPMPDVPIPVVLVWLLVKPRPTTTVRLLTPSRPPPPH